MSCPCCTSIRTVKRSEHMAFGYGRFRCCHCKRTDTLLKIAQYFSSAVVIASSCTTVGE